MAKTGKSQCRCERRSSPARCPDAISSRRKLPTPATRHFQSCECIHGFWASHLLWLRRRSSECQGVGLPSVPSRTSTANRGFAPAAARGSGTERGNSDERTEHAWVVL